MWDVETGTSLNQTKPLTPNLALDNFVGQGKNFTVRWTNNTIRAYFFKWKVLYELTVGNALQEPYWNYYGGVGAEYSNPTKSILWQVPQGVRVGNESSEELSLTEIEEYRAGACVHIQLQERVRLIQLSFSGTTTLLERHVACIEK